MKALIPFDSTLASFQNLQVACHDLLAESAADQPPRILVVVFEGLEAEQPLEHQLRESEQFSEGLLDQAMVMVQQLGLGQLEGQIIRCYREEETEALVELAQDWQAEAIYLPQAEEILTYPTKAPSRFRRWLGLFPEKLPVVEQNFLQENLVTLQLDKAKLLKLVSCPLVITGAEEVVMRLSYVYPGSKRQTTEISGNVRAALLGWPEYKPRFVRPASGKVLSTSAKFRQN